MYAPVRILFRLAAVGGAIAVGLTTHDAGFTAITFLGGLALPRVLGIGRRPWGMRGGFGAGRCGEWRRGSSAAGPAPGTV